MPDEKLLQKRNVAIKISIRDITTSSFVRDSENNLSFIKTIYGEAASRVNVIGTVVMKETSSGEHSVVMDDGSGKIVARSFELTSMMNNLEIGDMVMIIGKPREFNSEWYLSAEIAKKIDIRWANVRKMELQKKMREIVDTKTKEETETQHHVKMSITHSDPQESEEYTEEAISIAEYLKKNDSGGGVEISQIIKNCGKGAKENVDKMIKRGDIFEIRSGVLKLV